MTAGIMQLGGKVYEGACRNEIVVMIFAVSKQKTFLRDCRLKAKARWRPVPRPLPCEACLFVGKQAFAPSLLRRFFSRDAKMP